MAFFNIISKFLDRHFAKALVVSVSLLIQIIACGQTNSDDSLIAAIQSRYKIHTSITGFKLAKILDSNTIIYTPNGPRDLHSDGSLFKGKSSNILEPIIKIIHIPDPEGGGFETVAAEQVGENSYKILENPIFSCRLNYGTTVKPVKNQKGNLVVSKVIHAADFKTRQFLLSADQQIIVKEKLGPPLQQIGGTWETAMGGVLFIHVPKEADFDLQQLFVELNFFPAQIV